MHIKVLGFDIISMNEEDLNLEALGINVEDEDYDESILDELCGDFGICSIIKDDKAYEIAGDLKKNNFQIMTDRLFPEYSYYTEARIRPAILRLVADVFKTDLFEQEREIDLYYLNADDLLCAIEDRTNKLKE